MNKLQFIEHLHNKMGTSEPSIRGVYLKKIYESINDLSEAELIELSKKTLGSYIKKASKDIDNGLHEVSRNDIKHLKKYLDKSRSEFRSLMYNPAAGESKKLGRKLNNRARGIERATKKLTKEELDVINEVSGITVDHSHYVNSHGKNPKGNGAWVFGAVKGEYDSHSFTHNGPYAEAKRKAKSWAWSKGHKKVYTLG